MSALPKNKSLDSYPFEYHYLLSLCVGLQYVIDKHLPKVSKKVIAWKDALDQEFKLRVIRDGHDSAKEWLLGELMSPALPDLRKGKGIPDYEELVARYDILARKLRPIFQKFRRNPHSRNMSAAPIVSIVLGRQVLPKDLPLSRTQGRYCRELLNKTAQDLARARKRLKQEDRKKRIKMKQYFTRALSCPDKNPHEIGRLKKALDLLQRTK